MVYLRSGRLTTGDPELIPYDNYVPTAPAGGFECFFPVRAGKNTWSSNKKRKYTYVAIIGHFISCLGEGTDVMSAVDDAAVKISGHLENFPLNKKEDCIMFPDLETFDLEIFFLEEGMRWDGDVLDCEIFIVVHQGKITNFGWHKTGNSSWRVYEPPRFERLPY